MAKNRNKKFLKKFAELEKLKNKQCLLQKKTIFQTFRSLDFSCKRFVIYTV